MQLRQNERLVLSQETNITYCQWQRKTSSLYKTIKTANGFNSFYLPRIRKYTINVVRKPQIMHTDPNRADWEEQRGCSSTESRTVNNTVLPSL